MGNIIRIPHSHYIIIKMDGTLLFLDKESYLIRKVLFSNEESDMCTGTTYYEFKYGVNQRLIEYLEMSNNPEDEPTKLSLKWDGDVLVKYEHSNGSWWDASVVTINFPYYNPFNDILEAYSDVDNHMQDIRRGLPHNETLYDISSVWHRFIIKYGLAPKTEVFRYQPETSNV